VLDAARFTLYQAAMSAFTVASFRTQKVMDLQVPQATSVAFQPFAESFPELPIVGLVDPIEFPGEEARVRRIALSTALLGVVSKAAPTRTRPVPADHAAFLRAVYPRLLAQAWSRPPEVPESLRSAARDPAVDLIAELAVDGPFGSYLRAEVDDQGRATGQFVVDVDWLVAYRPRVGLLAPGGVARLAVVDGRLSTVGLARGGAQVPLAGWRGRQVERDAFLAGLNEDLTTIRHNLFVHLATLTPFAIASTNRLAPDHPVRRLLHHCFHTVLIGNHELSTLQLGGPRGFASTIFSHDHVEVARLATARLRHYDFWDLEPDTQFRRRGTTTTPFAYPYRDNVLELWDITLRYVRRYLALYFDDDTWSRDPQVAAWLDDLDRLLPNGLGERGSQLDWLSRVCATLIHVSTVEHDVLNNVIWDYSTLGWLIPTVAPLNGDRMDARRAFDLIATLVVTWKPYNMLLTAGVPSLALDPDGRSAMGDWIAELGAVQKRMDARGHRASFSYPANLNVSISN